MAKGIHQEYLDTTILPGEDFYHFVNGGWIRTTEIPADRSSWGSFHELSKNTDQKVLSILEEALATPGPDDNIAARLFETGMDLEQLEKARLTPIQHILDQIDALVLHEQLPALLGKWVPAGFTTFIHFSVHPDMGDSKKYAAYIEAANLGLPEREYYLDQDEKTVKIREEYIQYIIQLLKSEAKYTQDLSENAATIILKLEQELAKQMMSKEDRRQMAKLYNPVSYAELKERFTKWDWEVYFQSAGIEAPGGMIVTEPAFIAFFGGYLANTDLENIKHYLRFHAIHACAPYAHASLEEAHFDLFVRKLEGTEVMRPRKERMVKVINQGLGESLGQLFVSKYFPENAKTSALEMVGDIVAAFKNRIEQLEWMSEPTKAYATEKLAAFKVKIGYPDVWKDYSALNIVSSEEEGSYLQNLISIANWKFKKDGSRIGTKVDRDEWFMPPQMVNAYYNPMFNEIVFPAAILQPPFFDWDADAAVNYGGIGAVIGHEITHGFDDQGSHFDKEGNLQEWWTAEDRERFQARTQKLIAQFDAYFPFEDLPLNGTFTLGENIADLGGLSVAYDALQLYFQRHGRPDPIDGFTAEQRFFMSWATVWRTLIRPEALRKQIKTDPHPPGQYRAVAAPSNMDSFYQSFDILPDSKWYRAAESRIKIW